MTELFAGRYAFVDLLGSGGMGTVWRVWDAKSGVYCAAKVLDRADSTSLLRFIRETSWRVDHAHVLTPIGWAAADDRVLFTMPLLHGGTVGDLVRDFGALPDAVAAELLRQLLEALLAVHESGLIHRDVKPSNLLLAAPGTAAPHLYLSDFGIAAHADDPRLTRMGEAVGTRGYVAPEVLTGADPHPAQDLYGAGVVGFELLTGHRPPREGAIPAEELGGHVLRPLVVRLLAPRPGDRPTAAEALADLARLLPSSGPAWDGDVEVFDHVPSLPDGWSGTGPVAAVPPPAAPSEDAGHLPPATRTAPTETAAVTATTVSISATATTVLPTAAPTLAFAQSAPDAERPAAGRPGRRRSAAPITAVLLLAIGVAAIVAGILLLR